MRHVIALLATTTILSGCANTLAGIVGESVGVPMGDKVVSSKVEPNVLVAADGASCTVSKNQWDKVEVGRRYFCAWSQT
jgi:predicted small secreted protein